MANKAIDKYYLLESLKDFYIKILLTFFQKQLTATTIPSNPSNGDVIIYIGTTTANYICGHIYKYSSSSNEWGDITASGATSWGNIGGTLSNQVDLQDVLDNKYDINDPVGSVGLGDYVPYISKNGTIWGDMSWDGFGELTGSHIWSDGINTYYSYRTLRQYKLNGTTWESMAWGGFTDIIGDYIWTDGTNIYYSNGVDQYKLNGTTWESITWSGLSTNLYGEDIWTDGTNIYFSFQTYHYKLNGTTWVPVTWSGDLTYFYGYHIWSDGINIYYSESNTSSSIQFKLNGTTWESMTWGGYTEIDGYRIWTDDVNYYYSYGLYNQYKLNGTTWEEITWSGHNDIFGNNVWINNGNIYYSSLTKQYILRGEKHNTSLSTIKSTICDEYTPLVTQSNGVVVFDNLNPNYGYELQFNNISNATSITTPKWTNITRENGTTNGTIKLTYTISGGVNGSSQFALRIKK